MVPAHDLVPATRSHVPSRGASEATTLPARFRLVAAMTPYPWDEGDGARRPTPEEVARYCARVADTIGEHLHVLVKMRREPIETDTAEEEASESLRARAARAHQIADAAQGRIDPARGSRHASEGAVLTDRATQLLDTAQSKHHLSERRPANACWFTTTRDIC